MGKAIQNGKGSKSRVANYKRYINNYSEIAGFKQNENRVKKTEDFDSSRQSHELETPRQDN